MMHSRGKSVEPGELNTTANRASVNYVSRRQMRARSAGPMSNRSSRLLQLQQTENVGHQKVYFQMYSNFVLFSLTERKLTNT